MRDKDSYSVCEATTNDKARTSTLQEGGNEMETRVCDHEEDKPFATVIVKPIADCNLRCAYCYEGNNPYRGGMRMNYKTLRNMMVKFSRYNGPEEVTKFIWHGGEPLLMGPDFFSKIVEIQEELDGKYRIENGIQTNATLITEEFLSFFKEGDFKVGVSLDGPQWLCDPQRPYPDGRGSFEDVMTGIHLLEQRFSNNGRPLCEGVLAVLTRNTLGDLDEFYEFFQSNKLSIKVNPIFYEGRGRNVQDDLGIRPEEYGKAMIHFFDRSFYKDYKDGGLSMADPLDEMLGNLITGQAKSCVFSGRCYRKFFVVAPNGDVYPCAGARSKAFCLGNINEQELEKILTSPVLNFFEDERSKALEKCAGCEYFDICHGGCPRQSLMKQRDMKQREFSDKDYYCPSYKALYEHMHQALVQELGPSYRGNLDPSATQNPVLQKVIEDRLFLDSSGKTGEGAWRDSTWKQWRGRYSVWSGEYKDTWRDGASW